MDLGRIFGALVNLLTTVLGEWLRPHIANLFRRIYGWWQQGVIAELTRKFIRTRGRTYTPAEWEALRLLFLLIAIILSLNLLFWGPITGVFYAAVEWRFSIFAPLLLQLRHVPMAVREIVAFFFLLSSVFSFLSVFGLSLLQRQYQEQRLHTKLGRLELKKEIDRRQRKQRKTR